MPCAVSLGVAAVLLLLLLAATGKWSQPLCVGLAMPTSHPALHPRRACFVLSVCFEHSKYSLALQLYAEGGIYFDVPWASRASLGRTASCNRAWRSLTLLFFVSSRPQSLHSADAAALAWGLP